MNHCVPDWYMDDDTRAFPDLLPKGDWLSSQPKISMGPNKELVELLWRNGQVVLHSQTNRKSSLPSSDPKPVTAKPEQPIKSGFSGFSTEVSGLTNQNPIQEDVTASWLHYPLGDSLENEFCPDFFYEMSTLDPIGIEKPNKKVGENSVKTCPSELATNNHGPEKRPQSVNQSNNLHFAENFNPGTQSPMLPLEGKIVDTIRAAPSPNLDRVVNFSHFSRPVMASRTVLGSSSEPMGENVSGKLTCVEIGESSMTTIGSSNCGSNQVENQPKLFSFPSNGGNIGIFAGAVAEAARKLPFQTDIGETIEPTVTSTSGGSGVSAGRIGKRISMNQSNKRKGRDGDESEFQSEETEDDSVEANKPAQRSASARRKRAAEVHNLSERRRRDRINEKMKALQELIPHCNKSDKASMLDEAIEYLKSLQLQLQIMWMGGGMFPVMFPDVQHYMLPMGVGPAPSPAVNGPSQLASPNQLPLCIPPALNPVNLQNQIRNTNFSESYTRFLNFHHMQNSPQMVQQNHTVVQPNTSSETCIRSENVQSGKSG